jgi:hypothetical protein
MFESKTNERDENKNNTKRIPTSEIKKIVARIRFKIRKNDLGEGAEEMKINDNKN